MNNAINIGEKLRELRLEMGVSQKEVAQAVGVKQNSYTNYETGLRVPKYEILIKLCKYFSTSADYLLGLRDYE